MSANNRSADLQLSRCTQCGMDCTPNEYHPYAACLMYMACHQANVVRENLAVVRADGYEAGIANVQYTCQRHVNEVKNGGACVWCQLEDARAATETTVNEWEQMFGEWVKYQARLENKLWPNQWAQDVAMVAFALSRGECVCPMPGTSNSSVSPFCKIHFRASEKAGASHRPIANAYDTMSGSAEKTSSPLAQFVGSSPEEREQVGAEIAKAVDLARGDSISIECEWCKDNGVTIAQPGNVPMPCPWCSNGRPYRKPSPREASTPVEVLKKDFADFCFSTADSSNFDNLEDVQKQLLAMHDDLLNEKTCTHCGGDGLVNTIEPNQPPVACPVCQPGYL